MNVPNNADREPVNNITVLSVSPGEDDHAALERIFRESEITLYPNCFLALRRCGSLASALDAVREERTPVVLFDGDGLPSAWQELVAAVKDLPAPPCLIVTSQFTDDRMWAEVLKQGGFDVIAKPFQKSDVIRIVSSACRRWRHRHAQAAAAESRPAQK